MTLSQKASIKWARYESYYVDLIKLLIQLICEPFNWKGEQTKYKRVFGLILIPRILWNSIEFHILHV